jgi:subtilisin family serine protease
MTTSSEPDPIDANATVTLNELYDSTSDGYTLYSKASRRIAFGARAHLNDVGAVAGLTGEGVWIEVIDDFSTPHDTSIPIPAFQRTKMTVIRGTNPTSTAVSCTMRYLWNTTYTHGDLVSLIAGGTTPSQTLQPTLSVSNSNPACASSFYPNTTTGLTATLVADAIPGVASKATMQRSKVDLSSSQDGKQTWADIQGHLQNSAGDAGSKAIGIINLSLGKAVDGAGKTYQEVVDSLAQYPIVGNVNAVITVAAGNDGKPCNQINLNGCNSMAVALAIQNETKDSTIVVGALSGSTGASQTMADYSTRPGFLKDRFIWASGDSGFYPDASGNLAQGTSFAAPRVAGVAALLKQKYPNLTSTQIANVILESASKDMNNDGKDDFVGVDPIFGRGKLSLANALALAAKLYP